MVLGKFELGKWYTITEQIRDRNGRPTDMAFRLAKFVARSSTVESLDGKYKFGDYYMFELENGRLETVYAGAGDISVIGEDE